MSYKEQESPITYQESGVDYSTLDEFKVLAQRYAGETAINLQNMGYKEVSESRGESAYVWDIGDRYLAKVTEGLGTKNLIADETRLITDKTYYDFIAQDTVAMIVNDLIVVGAKPMVITSHFSVDNAAWFNDTKRVNDLLSGWTKACFAAGIANGGGETPGLNGIIIPGVMELSGDAVGEINPKERLTIGDKIEPGNIIIFLGSTGIHANGSTLARKIADKLPDKYASKMSDGTLYGEALLTPTPIYVKGILNLFEKNIDISYLINITGHGWRKLMRANKEVTYVIEEIPEVLPIFDFIKFHSKNDDYEMYGNFNMGAGFAAIVKPGDAERAVTELELSGIPAMISGYVEYGPKEVVIEPLNILFRSDSLNVRN